MDIIDGIKAASEPVIKLIDTVSHAIGKAYEPHYVKQMADAKAYEIRQISEELRNNSDLPIVYNGSQTIVDISDYDKLRQRTGARLAYQEIQRQANIEAIVEKACVEIEGKEIQSEEEVNPDWMSRFISNAGEVSNEEMQTIWAKILVGEVVQPKTFSLKTLDCVRNLTSDDAMIFTKVAQYIIHDRFLSNNGDLNRKYGISYSDILKMDECGLINSSGSICLTTTVGNEVNIIVDLNEYIVLCKCIEGETQEISVGEYPLTQAGKELLLVAREATFGKGYIKDIIDIVKKEANRCKVSLHKVNWRNGDEINYSDEEVVLNEHDD